MAEISLFEDEAFGVMALLAVINDTPQVAGQIGASGLFSEQGVNSTVVQIEKDGTTLALVPAGERGSVGLTVLADKRQLVPFNTVHLPQHFKVLADEIQGIRAVGSTTELQQAQRVIERRLNKAQMNLDVTHEFQRVGAINGLVLDADGKTVLLDIFQRFGLTRPEAFSFELNNEATDVSVKCVEVLDVQEDALGALTGTGSRAWCGKTFWNNLISQRSVRETYLASEAASALRGDRRQAFEFGGILWERYRGKLSGVPFVADNEARLVPEGVPDLFMSAFAPADYMETVNTEGLPYYAKLERMPFDKGIAGEAQSNPLHLCTKPLAVRTLTI